MNRQLLGVVLMCFGFSLVYAAAQTQPAAGPPAAAPATPPPPGETGTAAAAPAVTPSTPASLPDPKTPEEFFARARQLSDLEASGIPFHLKATYVASGDAEFTGNGTYEERWQSKELWRKEATLGDYKYVEIKSGGNTSAYANRPYLPLRLRQAMSAIEIGNSLREESAKQWQMQKKLLSGVNLTVLTARLPIGPFGADLADRADYFTSKGVLRISQSNGRLTLFNDWRPFQKLLVTRNIQVISGKDRVLNIYIDSLDVLDLKNEAMLTAVPPGLAPQVFCDGGRGIVAPSLLYRPLPQNPTGVARGDKPMVIIGATIDQGGNLRELYIEKSAGSFLDHEALQAFSHFRLKPATCKGKPIITQIDFPYFFINQATEY